jgi:hypothetical protein
MQASTILPGDSIQLLKSYSIKVEKVEAGPASIRIWGRHSETKERVFKHILNTHEIDLQRAN